MKAKLLNVAGTVIGECEPTVFSAENPLVFEVTRSGTPNRVVLEIDVTSGRIPATKGDRIVIETGPFLGHPGLHD